MKLKEFKAVKDILAKKQETDNIYNKTFVYGSSTFKQYNTKNNRMSEVV